VTLWIKFRQLLTNPNFKNVGLFSYTHHDWYIGLTSETECRSINRSCSDSRSLWQRRSDVIWWWHPRLWLDRRCKRRAVIGWRRPRTDCYCRPPKTRCPPSHTRPICRIDASAQCTWQFWFGRIHRRDTRGVSGWKRPRGQWHRRADGFWLRDLHLMNDD